MKVALICTTLDVPEVLSVYRRLAPMLRIFCAADVNTIPDAYDFVAKLGNAEMLDPEQYPETPYAPIRSIQRRNVALLEAIRWGADIILSVDTDDYPMTPSHIYQIKKAFNVPFTGCELRSDAWFDPGHLTDPPISHRGMPHRLDRFYAHPTVDRKVGVVASTVLGSCDISAVDRITNAPKRQNATDLARAGVIVDPARQWTLLNSEAIAFTRELAPAAMVWPGVGRYDDLFASMLMQRVMRETGHVIHYGNPLVYHERADRDYRVDLAAEMWGMNYCEAVAHFLDGVGWLGQESVLTMTRRIWNDAPDQLWMPYAATVTAGLAWCDAVEEAMK